MRDAGREPARASCTQQDLVDLAIPDLARPLPQVPPGEQPGFIVVGAEIRGAGMGNVDGNQWDLRFVVLGRNRRRHRLVGLKLDHQIDTVADQQLRVLEGNLRLVAVVDDDQFESLALGGAHESAMDLLAKRAVLPLRRIADAVPLAPADLGGEPVPVAFDLLDEAAVPEREEQAEAHALAEAGPIHDIAQAQAFAGMLEDPQNLRGVHQRLHQVAVLSGP